MNVRFSKLAVLAIVTSCLGFAHGQPETTIPITEQSQHIVQAATDRVARYETIEAKLRVQTDLLAQPLVGSGRYAQLKATSGLLLRLELAMQAGGQASSVKQICNGPDLWEHWRLGDKERLHHIDLRRIEQGLARQPHRELMGSASLNLVRGGLPKLLSQLERNFDFNKSPPKSGNTSGVEMWVVTGVWNLDRLAQLAPEAVENGKLVFDKLPLHLPHQVEVQFGKHDLFPYRIAYQRWSPLDGPLDGPQGEVMTPAVITEFYEVALNEPVDPEQFNYRQPTNVSVADRTDVFMKSLGIAERPKSAKRR